MAAEDISELKWRWLFWLIICCILVQAPCVGGASALTCAEPTTLALMEALDPLMSLSHVRPVLRQATPTNVSMWFTLYGILGVDEKKQVLTTYIWLYVVWRSEFYSWDPDQCGTDRVNLPRKQFWVPDILINEFMDTNTAPLIPYITLRSDGTMKDDYPVRVVSSCNLNIYNFPFDVQNCTFSFSSYVHQVSEVTVDLAFPVEDIVRLSKRWMKTMGEWELLDIKASKYLYTDDNIDALVFQILLGRRSAMYVVNLLLPSGFLITVDLFSFYLPPQSADRASFKMTLILGYTVFLLIMNDLLPVTGNTIPLINVFFSLCLALMVTSLLETIVITNLLRSRRSAVPRWVRVLVLDLLGRLVRLTPDPREGDSVTANPGPEVKVRPLAVPESRREAPVEGLGEKGGSALGEPTLEELRRLVRGLQAIHLLADRHLKGEQSSGEWIQVCRVIDRVLFILYTLFITVSFVTIVCMWASHYTLY